jgi:hypothetical protein
LVDEIKIKPLQELTQKLKDKYKSAYERPEKYVSKNKEYL